MKRFLSAFLFSALAGCAGGSDGFECRIGLLDGTWHVVHTEVDGTCGPIPDETVVLGGDGSDNCYLQSLDVSPDRCEMTSQSECVTLDLLGVYTVTTHLEQVSEDELFGLATVEMWHDLYGYCRSTYEEYLYRL